MTTVSRVLTIASGSCLVAPPIDGGGYRVAVFFWGGGAGGCLTCDPPSYTVRYVGEPTLHKEDIWSRQHSH